MLIIEPNPEKAKQLIKSSKETPIIVQALSPDYNRSLLEYGKFSQLLFPEPEHIQKTKKDKLKQLDTGINSIMAKIATKNKIQIAVDLNKIKSLDKKQKALFLSRLKEIIKICRKSKTPLKLINYKDKKDALALMQALGASSQQAQDAVR
jgi:RNase P/RNase MRP subunit p30